MADNQAIENGETPFTAAADEITSPYTGGTAKAQAVKVLGGAADDNTPVEVGGGTEDGALRVTVASDSTGVLSVDDNGSTLSVDDGGSTISVDDGGGVLTVDGTVAVTHSALTELAAAIDTEVQVDIVGALPAGTNAIGKLAANSGVDIGDVDVTSVPADPFGANADAAVAAGATGSIQAKLRLMTSQLDAIKTAVELLDDTVDSTEMQVDIVSMPAAARTTDAIAAALQTDAIMNGLTALTPKFFSETVAASDTDEELVALVSAKKIRVLALVAQCAATASDVTFESSTTTRKHKITAGANGGQVLGFNQAGWFETAAGESLTCTTSAGSGWEISGVYVEV